MRPYPYGDVPRLPEGPMDLGMLAGGPGPVEIEFGFGRAEFLLERARQRPDLRLVGVETRLKWVALAAQKASARGLANLRVYAGDGRRLAADLRPDASLCAAYFHFPDPWWKKRHAKRRLFTVDLALDLARLLVDEGLVFLQTDVQERAEAYREMLEAVPDFENLGGPGRLVDGNPVGIRSRRERRCEEEGLPLYRLSFRRRAR